MKKYYTAILMVSFAVSNVFAEDIIFDKTFSNVTSVKIDVSSSDVVLAPSGNDNVQVEIRSTYEEGVFLPEVIQSGSELEIEDNFKRFNNTRYGRNEHAEYIVKIPDFISVDIRSASGDISVKKVESNLRMKSASGSVEMHKVKGSIRITTASGHIDLKQIEGTADIKTASGDVVVEDSEINLDASAASGDITVNVLKGNLDISTASGDIDAENISLDGETELKSASGDLELRLDGPLGPGFELTTASGNIYLNAKKEYLEGMFEITAENRRASMTVPFEFDSEETYSSNRREYVTRTVSLGNSNALYVLETRSGKIRFKAN